MLGWEALDLASKYEGLQVKLDESIYVFRDNKLECYEDDVGLFINAFMVEHLYRNDWLIHYCPHPKEKITIGCGSTSVKDRCCHLCDTELEPEKPKLITWYRPKFVWCNKNPAPYAGYFEKSKSDFIGFDLKIIEWETIEAPETWEQCE